MCDLRRSGWSILGPERACIVCDETGDKPGVRRAARAALRAMSPARVASESAAVCRRIIAGEWWGGETAAGVVMLYWPMPGEVDVGDLARAALKEGRVVCLPRVNWGESQMTPRAVREWGVGLEDAGRGVMQPGAEAPAVNLGDLSLVIVPGVAFDPACFRVGRGGGFYDRFLANPKLRAACIGAAFDEHMVAIVPREPHDARLDGVVTPTRQWTAKTDRNHTRLGEPFHRRQDSKD